MAEQRRKKQKFALIIGGTIFAAAIGYYYSTHFKSDAKQNTKKIEQKKYADDDTLNPNEFEIDNSKSQENLNDVPTIQRMSLNKSLSEEIKEALETNIIKPEEFEDSNTETELDHALDEQKQPPSNVQESQVESNETITIDPDKIEHTLEQNVNASQIESIKNMTQEVKPIATQATDETKEELIDDDISLKWDSESYTKQFMFEKDNNAKFMENNQVTLYGTSWIKTNLIITNSKKHNRIKCKLIKIANKSDTKKGESDTEEYKLSFGLMHKNGDRLYFQLDAFDILNGQVQDIDCVFYKDKDDKDYNGDTVYTLNGKVFSNTQYNSNGKWDKNWFNRKIKEGDIFELVIKEEERKLIYLINDEEVASIDVEGDYPIKEVDVGFTFHIYQTKQPTIIQLL